MSGYKRKINDKLNNLQDYFEKNNKILTVFLFGSYGTGYETKLSDIDIAILYKDDIILMEDMKIAAEIELILNEGDVDLLNLNKASIIIKHKVISTGEIIFTRNSLQTANFIENTLKIYFDYGLTFKKYRDDYRMALKEEYL